MVFEKSKKIKLDDVVNIRMTKNEKNELKLLAKNNNSTVTDLIKQLIENFSNKPEINKEYLIMLFKIHNEVIREGNMGKIKHSFFQLENGFMKHIDKI